jgi:DNA mismatch repair protein MutS2
LSAALREFVAELGRRAALNAGGSRARVTPGQGALLARTIADIRRDLNLDAGSTHPSPAGPAPIGVGDRVLVTALDQEGIVAEDIGPNALVTIGAMRMLVPKTDLRRRGGPPVSKRERGGGAGSAQAEAAMHARTELDVRGKRFAEAEPEVDHWIDEALLLGHSPLRLIHGKGTGLLGRGLQQYLKDDARVKGVRYGNADEGGGGVTVFEVRADER